MATPYWTIRLAGPADTEALVRLARTVHGPRHLELDRAYWEWRYCSPPPFAADVLLAEHEGAPIGVQPVAFFDFLWAGATLRGALYTGVLTHPQHRRRGVFRSLLERANQLALERGAHFSLTTPNDSSLPGFQSDRQWIYPGTIPLYCRVPSVPRLIYRAARGLGGLRPAPPGRPLNPTGPGPLASLGLVLEPVTLVPAELDAIAPAFAQSCGRLMLCRNAAYLNWRYADRPGSPYRLLLIRHGARAVGLLVTTLIERRGLRIGLVLDVVSADGIPALGPLLRAAAADLQGCGADLVLCQASCGPLRKEIRNVGFLHCSPRWLPKRFHFVYRPTGLSGWPYSPTRLSDWHLALGDSDNT